jgi:3-methyladenine DNA glycosylase AlkC
VLSNGVPSCKVVFNLLFLKKMAENLKEQFNPRTVERLAYALQQQAADFPSSDFMQSVFDSYWSEKSLMQRVAHVSQMLHRYLDKPYDEALKTLQPVSQAFGGLFHLVFPDYVARYGLDEPALSFEALGFFTRGSTSEFAIRTFLQRYPQQTLEQMQRWARSDDEHLRRLASEGVRPRLPWATNLAWIEAQPGLIEPIIESLKADQSGYVRKSVANLLNDFSKRQSDWMLGILAGWLQTNDRVPAATQWIAKHALRTLLKQGEPRALQLMGYPEVAFDLLQAWQCASTVKMAGQLDFTFVLRSPNRPLGLIRLEYAIDFASSPKVKRRARRKVFKIAEGDYAQSLKRFECQHAFKDLTTRKHYPGAHSIELIVNGKVLAAAEFNLISQTATDLTGVR